MKHAVMCALAGMAGATVLTPVHQAAREYSSRAPRMDEVGMRALARIRGALGAPPV